MLPNPVFRFWIFTFFTLMYSIFKLLLSIPKPKTGLWPFQNRKPGFDGSTRFCKPYSRGQIGKYDSRILFFETLPLSHFKSQFGGRWCDPRLNFITFHLPQFQAKINLIDIGLSWMVTSYPSNASLYVMELKGTKFTFQHINMFVL